MTIRTCRSSIEANIAHGRLRAHGAAAVITGPVHSERAVKLDGLAIQVPADEAERAREILATVEPEEPGDEAADDARDGPRCPRCRERYAHRGRPPGVAVLSVILLGLPLLFTKSWWHCRLCNHWWRDATTPAARGGPYRG